MLFSRLESSANLKHHLPEMGMRDLFDIGKADLSGMAPNNNIFVSDVFHKAFIGNVSFLFSHLCPFQSCTKLNLLK